MSIVAADTVFVEEAPGPEAFFDTFERMVELAFEVDRKLEMFGERLRAQERLTHSLAAENRRLRHQLRWNAA